MEKKEYKGWLISTNFFKRAISVWLHSAVIQAIILTIVVLFVTLTS